MYQRLASAKRTLTAFLSRQLNARRRHAAEQSAQDELFRLTCSLALHEDLEADREGRRHSMDPEAQRRLAEIHRRFYEEHEAERTRVARELWSRKDEILRRAGLHDPLAPEGGQPAT